MRFLVIGGDAAGMSAASRAKRNLENWDVVVFEKTNDVSYSACGMPYNIADPERDMDDLVVRKAEVFREKQGIDLRTGHCVERIDRKKRIIQGRDIQGNLFSEPYDKLLIATGGSPILPEFDGIEKTGVMVLKNLEDGRKIKNHIADQKVEHVIIIGMGYIALEMCEAIRNRDVTVTMIKPGPIFLPWMPHELSEVVLKEVVRNDVSVLSGHPILGIENSSSGKVMVTHEKGHIDGEMVLVATGITPNSALASECGLELGPGNAVSVGKDMRTSDPDIFSAGDCADAFHVVSGQKTWIPLALRANRAGWAVADNVAGKNVLLEGLAGTSVFKVFDLQVARTGLTVREAGKHGFDPVEVVVKSRSRAHGHPGTSIIHVLMVGDRKTGRLLGAQMVGNEGVAHRINAVAVALHQKMTVDSYAQCDLAYAPPFGPVWDPTLTAANQLLKKM